MQAVSSAYKESMKQPIRNRAYLHIRIGMINQKAQENARANDDNNSFTYFSDEKEPFFDGHVDKIYATAEQDYSDESMFFLPKPSDGMPYYNSGIATDEILGSVYIDFGGLTGFDIKGLTIKFGEYYPTMFQIETYNGIKVYENRSPTFVTEDTFDGVSYFIIKPLDMVNGKGRLRIYQFYCGIVSSFTNKEIKSYSFKDYVSSITDTIPSQDMSLTVDNQNLYYDADDPQSALAYLEQGQEMIAYAGYDVDGNGNVEWTTPITSYLKSWSANDTDAKFSAVDIFDYKLSGTYYKGMYRENGVSLYDLAVDVFNDAGIECNMYFVDDYLKDIIVYNPMPVVKHSEALQIIANAGRCAMLLGRDGKISIVASFVPDMTIESDDQTYFSRVENLLNDKEKRAYAVASSDFTNVDKQEYFLPKEPDNCFEDTGYISNSVCDSDGLFEKNPVITINMEAGWTSHSMLVRFRNIAPEEFHIVTYYQGIMREDVVVNDCGLEYVSYDEFYLYDKMEFVFTKGYPNSRITIDSIIVGDITDYTITNSFDQVSAPESERQNKVHAISVNRTIYGVSSDEAKEILSEELVLDSGTTEYIAHFSNASYGLSAIIVDNSSISVEIIERSNYFAKLRFSGVTASGTVVKYSIFGKEYTTKEIPYTVVHNQNGEEKKWSNPLISTTEQAMNLEKWLSEYFLGDVDYNISWRGDPRTDANDLFYLERKDREKVLIRAYQNELTFNGAFSGSMSARKVVLPWQ